MKHVAPLQFPSIIPAAAAANGAEFLGSTTKKGTGANVVTDPIDTTLATKIVVFTAAFAPGPYSMTDSAGNTWAVVSSKIDTVFSAYLVQARMATGVVLKSANHTFTFVTGGGNAEAVAVVLVGKAGALELNATASNDLVTTTVGPTGVPAAAGSIFLSAICSEIASGQSLTDASADFTTPIAMTQSPSSLALSVAYKLQAAAEAEDCIWTGPANARAAIIFNLPYVP
jgi:hypothetical protein